MKASERHVPLRHSPGAWVTGTALKPSRPPRWGSPRCAGDEIERLSIHNTLGVIARSRGDLDVAERQMLQAIELAESSATSSS